MADLDTTLRTLRGEFVDPLAARFAAEDGEGRTLIAEETPREVRNAIIAAGIHRLGAALRAIAASGNPAAVPGMDVVADGPSITARIGDSHLVRIEPGKPSDRFETTEVKVSAIDPDGYEGRRHIAAGKVLRDGDRHLVSGHCLRWRLAEWFAFCDAVRPALRFPHERPGGFDVHIYAMPEVVRAFEDAVELDGGMPGEICETVIGELHAGIMREQLPDVADGVLEAARRLKSAGYVWGKQFLAYDDRDKHVFAVPVEGGLAVYHHDSDLMADHNAYLAIVGLGDDGKPISLRVHADSRDSRGAADLIARVLEGREPDPTIEFHLATGDLGRTHLVDPTGLMEHLPFAVRCDLGILREIEGGMKIGRSEGVMPDDDFSLFEPSEDDWDEDETPTHTI